eukprot:3190093-Amphidinium_carterae.1
MWGKPCPGSLRTPRLGALTLTLSVGLQLFSQTCYFERLLVFRLRICALPHFGTNMLEDTDMTH